MEMTVPGMMEMECSANAVPHLMGSNTPVVPAHELLLNVGKAASRST